MNAIQPLDELHDGEHVLADLVRTCSERLRALLGGETRDESPRCPTARRYGTLHETHSITLRTGAEHQPPPMS